MYEHFFTDLDLGRFGSRRLHCFVEDTCRRARVSARGVHVHSGGGGGNRVEASRGGSPSVTSLMLASASSAEVKAQKP